MPDYEFRAKEGPQKVVTGVLDAASEEAVIEKLHQMGYVPLRVEERTPQGKASLSFELLKSARYRNRKVIFFCRHMASLIKSGVPALKAIQVMENQERDRGFRDILMSLHKDVKEGRPLSDSLGPYRRTFAPVFVSMVRAGEATGDLPNAFLRISDYLKKEESIRTRVSQALTYPMILSVVGAGTVFFILVFVVPQLTSLFDRMGQELPLATRIIVGLGDFLSRFWIIFLGFGALLAFLLPRIVKQHLGRELLDDMALRVPVVGKLVLKAETARFARTLGLALSSGISFIEAVSVALPTLQNHKLQSEMEECRSEVSRGERFGESLRRRGDWPEMVTSMVEVGEESGHLDEVLADIADIYEQESEEGVRAFTTLLEPVTILVVGIIVGFIVIAMLLPVFEMNVGL